MIVSRNVSKLDFKAQPDIYSMREVCGIAPIDVKNITQRIYMVDANFMVLISLKSHESINRKLSAGFNIIIIPIHRVIILNLTL